MVKIIAIDLDGTLFDKKKVVSDENKEALKKAKENGIHIVIATGRPVSGVMPLLNELGLNTKDDYVIIYNGAKVFNVGTKELIFSSTINGKNVKDLYTESKRLGVNIHAFRENEELITPKHNPYTDVEATINHIEDHIFDFNNVDDNDKFLKCMMVDSEENITRIIPLVDDSFKRDLNMLRSSKIFLEFLNKSTNKGNALKALADYLNIDMKDTMAIGDAGNDLPMIQQAGYGVAMGNAFPEVKALAKYHTSTNEESGVAKAIYKYALNEDDNKIKYIDKKS